MLFVRIVYFHIPKLLGAHSQRRLTCIVAIAEKMFMQTKTEGTERNEPLELMHAIDAASNELRFHLNYPVLCLSVFSIEHLPTIVRNHRKLLAIISLYSQRNYRKNMKVKAASKYLFRRQCNARRSSEPYPKSR